MSTDWLIVFGLSSCCLGAMVGGFVVAVLISTGMADRAIIERLRREKKI